MAKLKYTCPTCSENASIESEIYLDCFKQYLQSYSCGHSQLVDKLALEVESNFISISGEKKAYPYQEDCVKFVEKTNFNCLIADCMGAGKTIEAILAARNAKLKPILVIQKNSTTYQWTREIQEWFSNHALSVCPLLGSQTLVIPGFDVYVCSMDSISRNGFYKKLLPLNIQCIIVDESHSFKDPGSKRTQTLIKYINESHVQHKIFLSGTPIKNRANEFFTTLNLLAPEHFPSLASFQRRWLVKNDKNVYSRVNPYRLEQFRELISRWVIRREKSEICPDLPELTIDPIWILPESEGMVSEYNKALVEVREKLESAKLDSLELLSLLAKLRQIVAIDKLPYTIEYVEEFLESVEDEKVAIGIHHTFIRDSLYYAFDRKGFYPLKLSGEDSAQRKDWTIEEFKKSHRRVLIINELAGGFGLNIQFCNNPLLLERQWNYADEDQFISRFHRQGQNLKVGAKLLMVKGSIDEWFDAMVNEKKAIFGETISGWTFTEDYESMRGLAYKAVMNPLVRE